MASSSCWGIEIGSGAIKALKLEADGENVRVAEFGVVNHPKVLSTPDLDQDDALRVAIGTLANQVDLSKSAVAISIPGHLSFARFAKLPPVEPKKVPDIVKFEAAQQVPFPLEEVEWDYQTFVSPDSPDVEVGIFAVTRQRIMERLTMLGDVGITPDVTTLSPIAAYNALAYDLNFTEKTPGTIILDVGTVATDLIIAEAGRVWVRTFPIGGHQFTEALVNTFKLTYSKAVKLKREAEQSKHARHIFQAMRPVFGDLVQEVQRSIGFYQSIHPDANLKRLIGMGSTCRLPGLRKYLKQQLGLDVYRMEQFKRLSVDGPRAGEFQAATLNLCTAYGLALQGLGSATLVANLMPVPVVREAMWKKKTPWFAAAAGLAAAAGGAMFIRPLLDSTAVSGVSTPAVLRQVSSDARRLSDEAQEAGVTGDANADLRAADLVNLFDGRELYAQILVDASALLADADAKLAQLPASRGVLPPKAFEVQNLTTQYVAAGGSAQQSSGRSSGLGFPGAAASTVAAVPPEVQGKRHVVVNMMLETAVPNPREFVLDTIGPWLNANARRDGVSYMIVASSDPAEYIPVADAGGAAGSRDYTGGGTGRYASSTPRDYQQGGFGSQGSTAGRSFRSSSGGSLDQIAPLPEPSEDAVDLAPTGRFAVTWYVVLDPPPAADAAANGVDDEEVGP